MPQQTADFLRGAGVGIAPLGLRHTKAQKLVFTQKLSVLRLLSLFSQPGMGAVWIKGTPFTAASVLVKPPGFENSTSQASMYRGIFLVNPWIITLGWPLH